MIENKDNNKISIIKKNNDNCRTMIMISKEKCKIKIAKK